jgi:DNA-binding NtrC family response regulator
MEDIYFLAFNASADEQKNLLFTVTLVDDDPLFRETLKDYLASMNVKKIDTFSSGEEFLSALRPGDKRLIVLDFDFGTNTKMNGLQVLEEIKKRNPDLPVILLSSQDSMTVALETLRKGATDYFIKGMESTFTTVLTSILKVNELLRLKKVQKDYFTFAIIGAILFLITLGAAIYNLNN